MTIEIEIEEDFEREKLLLTGYFFDEHPFCAHGERLRWHCDWCADHFDAVAGVIRTALHFASLDCLMHAEALRKTGEELEGETHMACAQVLAERSLRFHRLAQMPYEALRDIIDDRIEKSSI